MNNKEKIVYENESRVKFTNMRAIINNKTFDMSKITSVSTYKQARNNGVWYVGILVVIYLIIKPKTNLMRQLYLGNGLVLLFV